jgi:hypothetical protein
VIREFLILGDQLQRGEGDWREMFIIGEKAGQPKQTVIAIIKEIRNLEEARNRLELRIVSSKQRLRRKLQCAQARH